MIKYLLLLVIINFSFSATLVGTIKDLNTTEELMGASIYLKEIPNIGTSSDVGGQYILFDIPKLLPASIMPGLIV